MNKKGFTLTELLVVVVILGIIAGLSIPLIRNLSNMFEKKKYENYADSVLAAGKIFNDSYNEDLFGHNEYGCAYITYDKLVERKLIKDIEIDEMTCDSPKTYIRVIKQKDKYAYKTFLTCGTKREDGTMKKVLIKIPKEIPEMDSASCTGVNSGNLSVTADLTQANGKADKVKKKTRIKITSGTGIDNDIVLYAKWSKDTSDHANAGFTRVDFKVKENQEESLLEGELISTQSKELLTPDGNGAYYLIVRVDHLRDLYGHDWKNPDNTDSKYLAFGPFIVDSTPTAINTVVYKCDSQGNKTGSAITNKQVTSGSGEVFNLSNIAGNVSGWMTSSNYANGVCLGFELNDNLSIKSVKIEENAPGKQANASGYKTFDSSRATTENYESGLTNKTVYKRVNDDGHRYYRITVKDYAGHTTSMDVDLKLEKTAPKKPTINNTTNGKWVNKNVKLTISSSDDLIGMGEYYYSYNQNSTANGTNPSSQWVKLNGGSNKTNFTTEEVWNSNMDRDVYIRACDKLGNCSVVNNTKIRIDKTAPSNPTIHNPSNNAWVRQTLKLDISSTDTAAGISTFSGIDEYYYSYNGNATAYGNNEATQWVKINEGKGQTFFTSNREWSQEENKDLNQTVYFKVCDIAGNCSNPSNTHIMIDKTAPTVPKITNSSNGDWTISPIVLTMQSSDAASGLADYQYSYDNSSWTKTYVTTPSYEFTPIHTDDNTILNRKIYWRACDAVGNCSASANTSLKIDRVKPSCGSIDKTRTYSTDGVNGTIACSDSASGCKNSSYSFEDLKDNTDITIQDNVGNTNSCEIPIYVHIEYDYDEYISTYSYWQSIHAFQLNSSELSWEDFYKARANPRYICAYAGCQYESTTATGCGSHSGYWTFAGGYDYRPITACSRIKNAYDETKSCEWVQTTKTKEWVEVCTTSTELDSLYSNCQRTSFGESPQRAYDYWDYLPWVESNGGLGACWYNCSQKCQQPYIENLSEYYYYEVEKEYVHQEWYEIYYYY